MCNSLKNKGFTHLLRKALSDKVDLLGLEPRMPEPKTGVLPITP